MRHPEDAMKVCLISVPSFYHTCLMTRKAAWCLQGFATIYYAVFAVVM